MPWTNAGLMLVYRRRRWTNIKPALAQGIVLAGMLQLMGHHLPNAGECLMIYVYLLIKLTCHALNHNTSPHYMNEIYLTLQKKQVILFNLHRRLIPWFWNINANSQPVDTTLESADWVVCWLWLCIYIAQNCLKARSVQFFVTIWAQSTVTFTRVRVRQHTHHNILHILIQ